MFSNNFVSGGRWWIYIDIYEYFSGLFLELLGVEKILIDLLTSTQVGQLFTSDILK